MRTHWQFLPGVRPMCSRNALCIPRRDMAATTTRSLDTNRLVTVFPDKAQALATPWCLMARKSLLRRTTTPLAGIRMGVLGAGCPLISGPAIRPRDNPWIPSWCPRSKWNVHRIRRQEVILRADQSPPDRNGDAQFSHDSARPRPWLVVGGKNRRGLGARFIFRPQPFELRFHSFQTGSKIRRPDASATKAFAASRFQRGLTNPLPRSHTTSCRLRCKI